MVADVLDVPDRLGSVCSDVLDRRVVVEWHVAEHLLASGVLRSGLQKVVRIERLVADGRSKTVEFLKMKESWLAPGHGAFKS